MHASHPIAPAVVPDPTADPAAWLTPQTTGGASRAGLRGCSVERALHTHEHLFVEGERRTHVHLVIGGMVGVYALLADGRRQIVSFAYPGDLIGIDGGDRYRENAEALLPTRVLCVGNGAMDRLIGEQPGFGRALLLRATAELNDTRQRILSLGRRSAIEKLAGFLLRASERAAGAQVITLPMRRGDIADYLGLTIETVSRNFTRLRVAQVIRLMSHHGEVCILDLDRLEAIAAGAACETRH